MYGPCVDHIWTMYGPRMDHVWTIHGPYMIRTRSCMVHRKLRPDLQNLKKSLGNTIDSCHGKSLFALQDLQKSKYQVFPWEIV